MKEHVNFYENLKEARMRIENTTVLYDGDPYYVLAVTDHKEDDILRVYLDPYRPDGRPMAVQVCDIPTHWHDEPDMSRGQKMDQWLEKTSEGQDSGVIRKMMNSPKFNRFRPFPLGMYNDGAGSAVYVERKPTRYTQQGLTDQMLMVQRLLPVGEGKPQSGRHVVNFFGAALYNTIKGIYPSIQECVEGFREDKVANTSIAFDRCFALVKGPIGITYIAYKGELVGFLPSLNNKEVRLGREHQHLRELVGNLNYFDTIS